MTTTTRQEFTDGLRDMANWYDDHPDVPFPVDAYIQVSDFPEETKETVAALIRQLGSCKKDYSSAVMTIRKDFGPVALKFLFWRSAVCERVVVGKKLVPEQIIAAHEEEEVEWQCDPILETVEAT